MGRVQGSIVRSPTHMPTLTLLFRAPRRPSSDYLTAGTSFGASTCTRDSIGYPAALRTSNEKKSCRRHDFCPNTRQSRIRSTVAPVTLHLFFRQYA